MPIESSDQRFNSAHIDAWRREGSVLIPHFFHADEVSAVRADFETVFGKGQEGTLAKVQKKAGEIGRFDDSQFIHFGPIPVECSPALNLIAVHPGLVAFAKSALGTNDVLLYQCLVWAKFTGHADYDQAFHCDWMTHTLTVPPEADTLDALTFACYFSDVTEAHGPMHYVRRSDSVHIAGPEASLAANSDRDAKLAALAQSTASDAGSVFVFAMDVYHRATNLTFPGGHRYVAFASFKASTNHSIGYHAWPFHDMRPWQHIFDNATPEQLACFGVPPPGDAFWTEVTLARMTARYPDWKSAPYRAALA